MPVLLVLILGISIFSLTLHHTDDTGATRTGLEGFLVMWSEFYRYDGG